jgi:hypothetical protein
VAHEAIVALNMFGSADLRNLLELFPLMMGFFRWICWESAVRQYAIRLRVYSAGIHQGI